MTEIAVNPERLKECAKHLDQLADKSKELPKKAEEAQQIGANTWGALGAILGLESLYGWMSSGVAEEVGKAALFLAKSSAAMDRTAENYHAADEEILAHLQKVEAELNKTSKA
jgi:hypothetical protein